MSTPQLPRDFVIHRAIGKVEEECAYGDKHNVTYVESLYVSTTGETREHDNGYQKQQTELAVDRHGREYHEHVTIDYSNNVSWFRHEDKKSFSTRLPFGAVRDLSGKSLAKCPDGPSWTALSHAANKASDLSSAEDALRALGIEPTPEKVAEILAMKRDQS